MDKIIKGVLQSNSIIQRFFRKPPIVFPLVALYHVFLFGLHIYSTRDNIAGTRNVIEALWLLLSIVFLVFVCDMKRWAALGYIILTLAGLLLQFGLKQGNVWHDVAATVLFPFDLLITVLLLFYYKRFQ